jgi:hypothetical protein
MILLARRNPGAATPSGLPDWSTRHRRNEYINNWHFNYNIIIIIIIIIIQFSEYGEHKFVSENIMSDE